MLASVPKFKLPKTGDYLKRWRLAKDKFKAATGKKKPTPIKTVKIFHEKIGTIEKHQGTGVETTLKVVEKALPGAFKNVKGRNAYTQAVIKFRTTCAEYFKLLDQIIKTAPPEVDPKVWQAAILALKKELRHIQLDMAAYQERATQSEQARQAIAKNAEKLVDQLKDNVELALAWVDLRKRLLARDNEVDVKEYNTNGLKLARNISQGLMNMSKLRISAGYTPDRDRGPVPDAVEDAIEAFGSQQRKIAENLPPEKARAEYARRLEEYETAMEGMERWLG